MGTSVSVNNKLKVAVEVGRLPTLTPENSDSQLRCGDHSDSG